MGKDFVTVEWGSPKKDGGAKVTDYHIYMTQDLETEFELVKSVSVFDDHCTVKDLKEEEQYYFSVAAENKVGIGKQCKMDKPVLIKKPKGKLLTPLQIF